MKQAQDVVTHRSRMSGACMVLAATTAFIVMGDNASAQRNRAEQIAQLQESLNQFRLMTPAQRKVFLKQRGVLGIETINFTGDPSNRVDLVFLGDGFTEGEIREYRKIVGHLQKAILNADPFVVYKRYINVHRIDIISGRSGVNGRGPCGARVQGDILTSDLLKANAFARMAPDCDLIVVVANVRGVRSTGSYSGFYSTRPGLITLDIGGGVSTTLRHEMGHAWASLSDEYVDQSQVSSRPMNSPFVGPNVGRTGNIRKVRWHYFNPPFSRGRPVAGVFEGCYYRSSGAWRAAPNCLMRNGERYCPPCAETVELKFYMYIDVIDDMIPRATTITIFEEDKVTFGVKTLEIPAKNIGGGFCIKWLVDGGHENIKVMKNAAKPATKVYKGGELGIGRHEMCVQLDFINKRVVRDRGLMSSSRFWDLEILPGKSPKITAPERVQAARDEPITFPSRVEGHYPEGKLVYKVDLPEGFTYDEQRGEVKYAGGRPGVYFVTSSLQGKGYRLDKVTKVVVAPGSKAPKFIGDVPPLLYALEGTPIDITLKARDADGDHLAYLVDPLPQGARMNPISGRFQWTPGMNDAGEYKLKFLATDGRKNARPMKVRIVVQNKGSDVIATREERNKTMSLPPELLIRQSGSALRIKGLDGIDASLSPTYKLLVALKLLRDNDGKVSQHAARTMMALLDASSGASTIKRVALFLDDMNDRRIKKRHLRKSWQIMDKPWALKAMDAYIQAAENLASSEADFAKALKDIKTERDLIRKYQQWQEADPPSR